MLRNHPIDAVIVLLIGITALGSVLKFQTDFLNGKRLLSQLGGVLAVIQLIECDAAKLIIKNQQKNGEIG